MKNDKTLDTWFKDWTEIYIGKTNIPENEDRVEWCEHEFGIRGKNWDCTLSAVNTLFFHVTFRFKRKDDTMMFILKFGGSILTRKVIS